MSLFSQRNGLKPMQKAIQRELLDDETRNKIWTVLKICFWDKWNVNTYDRDACEIQNLLGSMWFFYFKLPADTQPPMHHNPNYFEGQTYYGKLRDIVINSQWHDIFDLIEFILANLSENWRAGTSDLLNKVLTDENSAYRIVSNQFIEITNETELKEVDETSEIGLDGVSLHINAAIKLMSDRKKPDYRNSIKESISAVESLLKRLTASEATTLSDGLKAMRKSFEIHPALLSGFEKIYAYTSDAGGIRHAMLTESKCSFSDAKFMLVSCSAFINYVIGKYAENGKKI